MKRVGIERTYLVKENVFMDIAVEDEKHLWNVNHF